MYVCGPTVYDLPHIGHGRANLVFDVLRRYLLFTGLGCSHVANITDVDDNIIKRAAEQGRTESEVAARIRGPVVGVHGRAGRSCARTRSPHATPVHRRHGRLVGELRGHGDGLRDARWRLPRGLQVDGYGLLAQQSLDSLQVGARVEANEDKRSPLDFALWKKAKAGEPSLGRALGPPAGPAGTPSASSCRSTCSARGSTCTAVDRTWRSRTTRTSGPRRWPTARPSPGTGCTTAGSRSRARRCPSRSATSPR